MDLLGTGGEQSTSGTTPIVTRLIWVFTQVAAELSTMSADVWSEFWSRSSR